MGRNVVNVKLNKYTILSKISQVSIFAVYTNLSEQVIKDCIDKGRLIVSPFRDDRHPSCGFRYDNKGKLKCRDFGGTFWGDCFDVVALVMSRMYKRKFDVNDKNDFINILKHIRYTFAKEFYSNDANINHMNALSEAIEHIKHDKQIIEIVTRMWNDNDIYYWRKIGVNINYLNVNFVYPVEQYYINRNNNPLPKYFYDPNDPAYAYFLGKDSHGIDNIKIYFPYRSHDKTRFITNCNHLEGIYNLDRNDYDIILITKSSKDRLSIGCTLNKLHYKNIGIINIPHETHKLTQNEYNWLANKLNKNGIILSLMDNDKAGLAKAIWLRDNYEIYPLIIDKYKYKAKDFAELYEYNDFEVIKNIIQETITYINTNLRNEEGNDASWNNETGDTLPF